VVEEGWLRLIALASRGAPCPVRLAAVLSPYGGGRVYAAYGGVYVSVAIFWLWFADAVRPTAWDLVGVVICLVGMAVDYAGPTPCLMRRLRA
jgi:small multidrug resistance family-3 protein